MFDRKGKGNQEKRNRGTDPTNFMEARIESYKNYANYLNIINVSMGPRTQECPAGANFFFFPCGTEDLLETINFTDRGRGVNDHSPSKYASLNASKIYASLVLKLVY